MKGVACSVAFALLLFPFQALPDEQAPAEEPKAPEAAAPAEEPKEADLGAPIYPGSRFDQARSKLLELILGNKGGVTAVYTTEALPDSITAWYEKSLGKKAVPFRKGFIIHLKPPPPKSKISSHYVRIEKEKVDPKTRTEITFVKRKEAGKK